MTRRTLSQFLPLLFVAAVLAGPGCGRPQEPPRNRQRKNIVIKQLDDGTKTNDKSPAKTAPAKTGDTSAKSKTPKVALRPFDPPKAIRLDDVTPKELDAFIAKQTGKKHAVVVDYWATWCAPCKKIFPHTVELSKRHAKDGLVVISVCVDDRESRDKAKAYLESEKAYIFNLFPNDKLDPDTLAEQFNVPVYPLYRVYGPDGKLAAEIKPPEKAKAADVPKLMKPRIDAAVKAALGLE